MNTSPASIRMPRPELSAQDLPSPAGRKILIVDDNLVILKTLKLKLEASSYQVLTADDGSTAVSVVRREKPDLILLDIYFPPDVGHGGGVSWDGFLILSWLRRMEEAVNTPVIVITGAGSAADRERCLQAGVADYFQKPIDPEQLLASIQTILGQVAGRES